MRSTAANDGVATRRDPPSLVKLGLGDSLAGLYTYATLATVIAVAVLIWLGRIASRIGGEAAFQREAEG